MRSFIGGTSASAKRGVVHHVGEDFHRLGEIILEARGLPASRQLLPQVAADAGRRSSRRTRRSPPACGWWCRGMTVCMARVPRPLVLASSAVQPAEAVESGSRPPARSPRASRSRTVPLSSSTRVTRLARLRGGRLLRRRHRGPQQLFRPRQVGHRLGRQQRGRQQLAGSRGTSFATALICAGVTLAILSK